jgi:hypothetical protein
MAVMPVETRIHTARIDQLLVLAATVKHWILTFAKMAASLPTRLNARIRVAACLRMLNRGGNE